MEKCDDCGKSFKRVSGHWARTSCGYPEYTTRQKEIVRGLVLGDGYVETDSAPALKLGSTNKEFLEWVDGEMGNESTGVRFVHVTDAGSDYYTIRIRYNPYIEAHTWGSNTNNDWPRHMRITPLVIGLWYAGDGHYYEDVGAAEIGVSVSKRRRWILESYLAQAGLDARIGKDRMHFRQQEAERLQAYAEPIPGYTSKWG